LCIAGEQARKTKRIEVGNRKRVRQGRAVRQTPRAVWAACRLCGEVPTDPEVTQLRVPLSPAFPLLPDHGSQPTPYPFIQSFQQRRCLTESEVALPTSQIVGEFLHHLFQADSSCPLRQLPDFLLAA